MTEEKQVQLEVSGDLETRKGSYANTLFITSQENEDILDFFFMDSTGVNGEQSGVLTSRVIVSRQTLLSFRDALNQHLGGSAPDAK